MPLITHSSLWVGPQQLQRQPQSMAIPTETIASQPTCWTRSKGSRWVREEGRGSTSPPPTPPQPVSGPGTLSSYAYFIPGHYLEGMGDSHLTPSHPRVLHSQLSPESWRDLPSPCTEDSHLFCSINPFLQAWDSYRGFVH